MMLGLGPFLDMRFVLSIYDIKCLVSVLEIHFYTHAHTNSTSTQISIIFIEYSFSSLSQGGAQLEVRKTVSTPSGVENLASILTLVSGQKRRQSNQSDEAESSQSRVELFRHQLTMLQKLFKNQPPRVLLSSLQSK